MTAHRWNYLMTYDDGALTEEEINEGWHWCVEFDGLLVGPGSAELHACSCLPHEHPVYKTMPPIEDLVINEDEI